MYTWFRGHTPIDWWECSLCVTENCPTPNFARLFFCNPEAIPIGQSSETSPWIDSPYIETIEPTALDSPLVPRGCPFQYFWCTHFWAVISVTTSFRRSSRDKTRETSLSSSVSLAKKPNTMYRKMLSLQLKEIATMVNTNLYIPFSFPFSILFHQIGAWSLSGVICIRKMG